MKTCQLCGQGGQADDTATCPNDGEASWSQLEAEPEAEKPKSKAKSKAKSDAPTAPEATAPEAPAAPEAA